MRARFIWWGIAGIAGSVASASLGWLVLVSAQEAPRFTAVQPLTNKEVRLVLTASTGLFHRLEASTALPVWEGFATLPASTTTSLQHTDAAAAYLSHRFYRAQQLQGTNHLTGDILATTNGDVVIHPLYHASFVMSWNGKIIYNDPDDDPQYEATYRGLPKADLILVSHSHGDHFSSTKIEALRGPETKLIVPQAVYTSLTAAQRTNAIVLGYGASTNVMGLTVQAVPGYNGNHSFGINNCYVVTLGGKRLFMSGDTGNVAEIRALQNIDVAFLCMNTPFTMTPNEATNSVRAFRPKVVYPYHYRNQSGTTTNAAFFKQILGTDLGIEVRLRKWY